MCSVQNLHESLNFRCRSLDQHCSRFFFHYSLHCSAELQVNKRNRLHAEYLICCGSGSNYHNPTLDTGNSSCLAFQTFTQGEQSVNTLKVCFEWETIIIKWAFRVHLVNTHFFSTLHWAYKHLACPGYAERHFMKKVHFLTDTESLCTSCLWPQTVWSHYDLCSVLIQTTAVP